MQQSYVRTITWQHHKQLQMHGHSVLFDQDFLLPAQPAFTAATCTFCVVSLVDQLVQAFLIDGMESLSQAKVGSALQVFFNLDQLQEAVDSILQQHLHELERTFKQSLDSRHLSMTASSAAAAGGGAAAASAGPGGARGLVLPAPGAAGSWQVGGACCSWTMCCEWSDCCLPVLLLLLSTAAGVSSHSACSTICMAQPGCVTDCPIGMHLRVLHSA